MQAVTQSALADAASRMVGQPQLERVELQVWWMSGSQERSFTLDAHRTRTLAQGDL